MDQPIVALAGNPNSGKTTLFNRLTGLNQRVGNYPGVTVEKKTGRVRLSSGEATIVDLPGTYSLVARSREETIAYDVLSGRGELDPTLAVIVIDASNLERNLYLALQIIELGRPVIIALNMIDAANNAGIDIDHQRLTELLGVRVVPIAAAKGIGIDALRDAIANAIAVPGTIAETRTFGEPHFAALFSIAQRLPQRPNGPNGLGKAAWLVATLADTQESTDNPLADRPELAEAVAEAHSQLKTSTTLPAHLIEARYAVASALCQDVVRRTPRPGKSVTDRIDGVLLHRAFGPLVLIVVMAVVFQSIFAWAEPLMDIIESGVGVVGRAIGPLLPEGAVRDLLVDGVIAGVGSVLVFIPQIAFLFFAVSILEDSGYLARAAYIMDRVMAKVGLHGRAFVPLLSGFACAIPGIMAARTIENPKDRMVTILVLPLITCSARLPVYALLISALFSDVPPLFGFIQLGGVLLLGMYAASIALTITVAAVLKRTILKSPTPPLVLELPPYRMPQFGSVARRVYERCSVFVRDAGTVILACSIVLWGLLSYPKSDGSPQDQIRNSYAGRVGRAIEPAIEPLGYDWKIGVGLIGSFAAREVMVATLGLVYGVGEADEQSLPLREALKRERNPETGRLTYTPLVGLSLMVFFLIAAQCMSTLAVIRRETASFRWPVFMFTYATLLAWCASFLVYQGGRLLGFT